MNIANLFNTIRHVPYNQLEVEFRAGLFEKKRFVPGIDQGKFETLLQKLLTRNDLYSTKEHIVETIHGEYRIKQDSSILKKVKLWCHDFIDEGLRLAIASEIQVPRIQHFIPENKHSFQRQKERISFVSPEQIWRLDFTKVLSLQDKDEDRYSYEIELELIRHEQLFIVPVEHLLAQAKAHILHVLQ